MIEFFQQGGYAGYVWSSYGMIFGLLLVEVLQLRSNRRTTLTRIGRLVRLRAPQRRAEANIENKQSESAGMKP